VMIAWPARLGLHTLRAAFRGARLLRPTLAAIWLAALLGWLANDSGVSVSAAALPFTLPLAIAVVAGLAADGDPAKEASRGHTPARSGPGMLSRGAGRANL
jgi:hypothetical protein